MKKILVIDAQGGGLGKQLITRIKKEPRWFMKRLRKRFAV